MGEEKGKNLRSLWMNTQQVPLEVAKCGRKDCWGLLVWFGSLVKAELHLETCIYSHEINAKKKKKPYFDHKDVVVIGF